MGRSQKKKPDTIFSTADNRKSEDAAGLVLHYLQGDFQHPTVSEESHEGEAQDVERENQPSALQDLDGEQQD